MIFDGQPILCIGGLPPRFPPSFKHGFSPIPLDEVMERHATEVTNINGTSKDKGVAFTGISHNRFVLPTSRAHTPECFFPIEVVSSPYPIQFVRHFQKEWILNMQICSELVSHKITPAVTDC